MKLFDTIFCDLDGVCSDFHLEAIRAHMRVGRRFPTLDHNDTPLQLTHNKLYRWWTPGESISNICSDGPVDTHNHWSPSMDAFWQPIRSDPFFWQNLPGYEWTFPLVKLLEAHCEHFAFVTTPDKHRNSYAGKYHWLQKNKLDHHELIMMKNKWRLARPRCLLIDDFEVHIKNWQDHTDHLFREVGHALLFPQPWNEGHPHTADRLGYVESYLKEHCT